MFTRRGARFFALDLRKYGRSLRDYQTPGFVRDLSEYDADFAAALAAMRTKALGRSLLLVGHSTGGLTLSLWLSRLLADPGLVPDAPELLALVLNSPWLEFQLSAASRHAISPLMDLHAKVLPHATAPQFDFGFYARAQREVAVASDCYETVEAWRPEKTMPVHVAWLNAVLRAQGQLLSAGGGAITVPVQVLLSARTAVPTHWSMALTSADSVLVVDDIARAALKLGSEVTVTRIDGALHDVFLSAEHARNDAYLALERFLDALGASGS